MTFFIKQSLSDAIPVTISKINLLGLDEGALTKLEKGVLRKLILSISTGFFQKSDRRPYTALLRMTQRVCIVARPGIPTWIGNLFP